MSSKRGRSPMPVFDEIIQPGTRISQYAEFGDELFSNPQRGQVSKDFIADLTANFIRVQAGATASEIAISSTWQDFVRHCGPQRLPFSDMWIEYETTSIDFLGVKGDELKRIKNDIKEELNGDDTFGDIDVDDPVFIGCLVTEEKRYIFQKDVRIQPWSSPVDKENDMIVFFKPFIYTHGYTLSTWQWAIGIRVTKDGSVGDCFVTRPDKEDKYQFEVLNEDAERRETRTFYQMIRPVMAAIGLMNCKNITLERHARPHKQAKKSRRKRPDLPDYHTIVLPEKYSTLPTEKNADGTTSPIPLHKVRGHFKTYTKERPLMGKHVGTYWWGWQARGKSESGKIVADYQVGES